MTKFLSIALLFSSTISLAKKPNSGINVKLKYSNFSVVKKKKKIILSCKPLKLKEAANSNWVSECNNVAYNLLTQEYYQEILIDKEILDNPFGNLSYQAVRDTGVSNLKKKAIRKSFKIHAN